MQVVVITNQDLKKELLSNAADTGEEIIWVDNISQVNDYEASDVIIDLLFEREHISILQQLISTLVIINSVEETLAETNASFVRINGWPTFLKSSTIEASSAHDENKNKAEKIFSLFNKKLEWLPDEIGFITPRVIGMIINEAFISLKEGISTKEEIDIAMKLGTNYPYGPFEWAEKIGIEKVDCLLKKLSKERIRYTSQVR